MDTKILPPGQPNPKFLTLTVLSPSSKSDLAPPVITTNESNNVYTLPLGNTIVTPLFNELYLHPINFGPKNIPVVTDNKRIIPENIEKWSTQNKIIKPKSAAQSPIKPTSKKTSSPSTEKVRKKQFIEIDLLYGDIDRMLVLLRFCYPQLNNVPEHELREEIEKFLKYLTRNRYL